MERAAAAACPRDLTIGWTTLLEADAQWYRSLYTAIRTLTVLFSYFEGDGDDGGYGVERKMMNRLRRRHLDCKMAEVRSRDREICEGSPF